MYGATVAGQSAFPRLSGAAPGLLLQLVDDLGGLRVTHCDVSFSAFSSGLVECHSS
jgi:hypothetical protein